MKIVQGDLINLAVQGQFDVIIHGCNCQCTMGSGIARAVRNYLPEAWKVDQDTVKGDRDKLGTYTAARVIRGPVTFDVVNAYTQFSYGHGLQVDYDALASAMRRVKASYSGKRIGYPKIGAGLGGGDWEKISTILETEFSGEDHTLVEFTG